jgi:hypothetical protein
MKLLSYAEFVLEPDGVIYQEYDIQGLPTDEGILVRAAVLWRDGEARDFIYARLTATLDAVVTDENLNGIEFESYFGRWGLYEYENKYLVYEPDDLYKLSGWLLSPLSYDPK